jgi:hypothetical protein
VTVALAGGAGGWSTRLGVLGGDADGSGTVLADDYSAVKRRFFSTAAGAGDYSVFCDVNGSGAILADDFSEVRRRFFQALPAAVSDPVGTGASQVDEAVTSVREQVLC